MRVGLLSLLLGVSLLGGCGRNPHLAADTATPFDPLAFFDGSTRSRGVIEDRSGAPTQWIRTDSRGTLEADGRLRMAQNLAFQDGTRQVRDWTLWRDGPNHYEATANDMLGTAEGQADGRTFHWQWVLARRPGNALMNVTMSQWMYRMDDGSVLIRTTVSKLGIIVAEVTEQFTRAPG